jgi:pyruvate dehydrogenase E2 component (dihydrolipoamide acetyltransferase)
MRVCVQKAKGPNGPFAFIDERAAQIKTGHASHRTLDMGCQDGLPVKLFYHIGFAADTPNGLMVPVIKDCDKRGILQISQEMGELAKKARDGKLSPAEMSGATFTISSLGGMGGRYFTPIINAPEVSILGVCKSQIEPKWDGKTIHPHPTLGESIGMAAEVAHGSCTDFPPARK